MACVVSEKVCKRAAVVTPWGFNWALHFARKWAPATPFATGVAIRPTTKEKQTGFEYVSSGGVSNGAIEPRWPKTLTVGKNTVVDGSITWTARAISADSLLEELDTATWEITPAGVEIEEAPLVVEPAEQSTGGQFSGGTKGQIYSAIVTVTTTDDNTYQAELEIEVE